MLRAVPIPAGTRWTAALLALGCALAQPPNDPPDDASRRHADLHVRYATARLQLAETRLRKAEQLNATSPGQVAESDMRSLRTRIDLLREGLDETRGQPHGSGFASQRKAARSAVRLAEQDVEEALAVNRRKSDAVAPLDVRLRELRLEIARLRAELWNDPTFLASTTAVLQMQIDQLADQLQDVLFDLDNSPTVNRR